MIYNFSLYTGYGHKCAIWWRAHHVSGAPLSNNPTCTSFRHKIGAVQLADCYLSTNPRTSVMHLECILCATRICSHLGSKISVGDVMISPSDQHHRTKKSPKTWWQLKGPPWPTMEGLPAFNWEQLGTVGDCLHRWCRSSNLSGR